MFSGALVVLAAGIIGLPAAANPYVAARGKPETASGPLDLRQAFNFARHHGRKTRETADFYYCPPLAIEEIKALSPPRCIYTECRKPRQ